MDRISLPFVATSRLQPTPQYVQIVRVFFVASMDLDLWTSEIADVGHACEHAPQDTHAESSNEESMPLMMRASNPRPCIESTNCPCISSHARTQREQLMHFERSEVMYGCERSLVRLRWFAPAG